MKFISSLVKAPLRSKYACKISNIELDSEFSDSIALHFGNELLICRKTYTGIRGFQLVKKANSAIALT